jgi:hypothetical protein
VLRQLIGIKPMLDAIESYSFGSVYSLCESGIYSAISEFERDTHVDLSLKTIVTFPAPGQVQGVDYDLVEDQYDYQQMDYARLGYYTLRHRPVMEILRVAIEYSLTNNVYTFPADWIRLNSKMGRISIVPNISDANNDNYDYLFFLPRILSGFGDIIPTMVSIDYVAGIADLYNGTRWADLRMWLNKRASLFVREAVWEMLPNGGGIDGASASFASTEAIAQRIDAGWAEFKTKFRQHESPIMMAVL